MEDSITLNCGVSEGDSVVVERGFSNIKVWLTTYEQGDRTQIGLTEETVRDLVKQLIHLVPSAAPEPPKDLSTAFAEDLFRVGQYALIRDNADGEEHVIQRYSLTEYTYPGFLDEPADADGADATFVRRLSRAEAFAFLAKAFEKDTAV